MPTNFSPDCRRCAEFAEQGSTAQNYEYNCDPSSVVGPHTLWFDIEGAHELIKSAPRLPLMVNPATLPPYIWTELVEEHVAHVPLAEPGIVASVAINVRGVGRQLFQILIDGSHRAARARQIGKQFAFYLLTEAETNRIVTTDITAAVAVMLSRLVAGGRGQRQ